MTEPVYSPILQRVLGQIAHDPLEIEERWTGLHRCILIVNCSPSDIGILSGKSACVIKAVQDLFSQIGRRKQDEIKVGLNADGVGERRNRTKVWEDEQALDYAFDLLHDMGFETLTINIEPFRGGHGLAVHPKIDQLYNQINTVLEAYGRSRGKAFGLAE